MSLTSKGPTNDIYEQATSMPCCLPSFRDSNPALVVDIALNHLPTLRFTMLTHAQHEDTGVYFVQMLETRRLAR